MNDFLLKLTVQMIKRNILKMDYLVNEEYNGFPHPYTTIKYLKYEYFNLYWMFMYCLFWRIETLWKWNHLRNCTLKHFFDNSWLFSNRFWLLFPQSRAIDNCTKLHKTSKTLSFLTLRFFLFNQFSILRVHVI